MINYIWGYMIIVGICYSIFTGNIENVNNGITETLNDTLSTILSMSIMVCFWEGMINIATQSGIIKRLTRILAPILKKMFRTKNEEILKYIGINLISNMIGIGGCAIAAGINAFQLMQKENKQKIVPSPDMSMFLLINISSVQLFSMNLLMQREKYGSNNPSSVIIPGLCATIITTLFAIIFCIVMEFVKSKGNNANG